MTGPYPHSCIPKLHVLEEHVAPFIRQWRVGLGMLGEHGVEGIHARFNTLERTYSNMSIRLQRLQVCGSRALEAGLPSQCHSTTTSPKANQGRL